MNYCLIFYPCRVDFARITYHMPDGVEKRSTSRIAFTCITFTDRVKWTVASSAHVPFPCRGKYPHTTNVLSSIPFVGTRLENTVIPRLTSDPANEFFG